MDSRHRGRWRTARRRRGRSRTASSASVSHAWARDASAIYFVSDRRPRAYSLPDDADIYSVGKDGGEPRLVVSIDGRIGAFTVSPDGRRVAFVAAANGKPERSFDQPDLWVATIDGGSATNLTASYNFDIGGGLSGDQRAPRGQHPASPVWTSNDERQVVRAGHQGSAPLVPFRVGDAKPGPTAGTFTHSRGRGRVVYRRREGGVRFALVLVIADPRRRPMWSMARPAKHPAS